MPDRYTDPHTGELIVPGKPEECAGNVERGGFSCDECDYFLKCFPECDPDNEAINLAADEILHKYRRAFEELAK